MNEPVLVVGAGLIGTSVGLAARAAGREVLIDDADRDRVRVAVAMGAGREWDGQGAPQLVVVAVPPAAVGRTCAQLLAQLPSCDVSHVCSVQSQPAHYLHGAGSDLARFVGSHPIAGREVSGPTAASADLFVGRPWAVCPVPGSGERAIARVVALAQACGAEPVVLPAGEHDELLATLSHTPQLVASALAATLTGVAADRARLAGTGFRDTTRLADSDPGMWGQIAAANAVHLARSLRAVAEPLRQLADLLDSADQAEVEAAIAELMGRGRRGRALLPGKHGRAAMSLSVVRCVVSDQPGTLARLFGDIATAGVNVEDFRVEHAPGSPVGVVALAVAPASKQALIDGLRAVGWTVTEGPEESL
jgi:prephenate dehydrogenase